MDVDLGALEDWASRRTPTTWVAFEANVQNQVPKPKRRKGARGRATAAEMAALVEYGEPNCRREHNLRPEQVEALRLKREPKDLSLTCLDQEDGEGNVEYKYRIKDPHPVRLQQLITQMKYRLSEGSGECFYYIGIEDNGYPKGLEPADLEGSIAILHRMAASLGAYVTLVHYLPAAWGRRAALLRVATSTAQEACHTDLRIAVAGSVDAGKSTLVAVLTHGSCGRALLDNGRGLARMNVFRHKHEMKSGRTSSICHQLLGYDKEGRVINYATPAATAAALTPAEITSRASKVLTFLDMGGHEKYLKTALYGMTALLPDFGLLCVCAVAGLGRIAREHLAIAVALEVPVAIVITKIELVQPERFTTVLAEVRKLVALTMRHESSPGTTQQQQAGAADVSEEEEERRVEAASPLITNEADALASAHVLCQLRADSLASSTARGALRVHMPIVAVSAVTGSGLPVLHAFLNALQPIASLKGLGSCNSAPLATSGNSAMLFPSATSGAASVSSVGLDSSCDGNSSSCGMSAGGSPVARATDSAAKHPFPSLDGPAAAAAAAAAAAGSQHQLLYAPAAATAVPAAVPADAQAVHFQVDGTFEVEGVGSVVSGTLVSGMVRVGQELLLGPTSTGDFTRVLVRQLQRSHLQVKQVRAGQTCTIAISPAAAAAPPISRMLPANSAVTNVAERDALTCSSSPGLGSVAVLADWAVNGDKAQCSLESTTKQQPSASAGSVAAAVSSSSVRQGSETGFEDALAAAQTALELCLAGGNDPDDDCGAVDDELFDFDAPEGPTSPVSVSRAQPTSQRLSLGAGSGPPFLGFSFSEYGVPMSNVTMSACRLHSTTSFCVGAEGSGADATADAASLCGVTSAAGIDESCSTLSTSAPTARNLTLGTTRSPFRAVAARSKGSVLLEPALQPRTSWTFEAVLVLLGGHWPPRGLVSGRWPPAGDENVNGLQLQLDGSLPMDIALASMSASDLPRTTSSDDPPTSGRSGSMTPASGDCIAGGKRAGVGGLRVGALSDGGIDGCRSATTVAAAAASSGDGLALATAGRPKSRRASGASGGKSSRRRRQRPAGVVSYVTVVHCGSVRQPAHILMMQELLENGLADEPRSDSTLPYSCPDLRISASTRAAAALLHSASRGEATKASPATACQQTLPDHDLGCLVRVVFRWQHRPEWLREGAKLLVRDRGDGRVAGAGFVRRVLF